MKKIFNIISWIIILIILIIAFNFYKSNNLNGFIKSEANLYSSQFKRDNKIKYSKNASYRISSEEPNDATILKNIKVEKNTPYKVTCKIKTENVVSEDNISGTGAQISIIGTTEKSTAITGTNDWQEIELIFNSKNREDVDIGFRLGGYLGNCTGTVWFSDFTIESGVKDNSNEWKFACFIFENTDVEIEEKQIKISMTDTDISDIKDTINRFQTTCSILSENKMKAKCDIYNVKNPIKKLTYDKEFGYYVSPEDIESSIKDTIQKNDYDHIFIIIRLGNEQYINDIKINDWIGLGAMDYYGIGYSNIRLPNSSKSYIYKYDTKINTFPEEVFLHEFLHSLERTAEEYEYTIPALHDYEKYGYKNENAQGLKKWYQDYMNSNIKTTNGTIGLPKDIYTLKPAKISEFEYSYKMQDKFKEPENIIEEISQLINNITNNIKTIMSKKEQSSK